MLTKLNILKEVLYKLNIILTKSQKLKSIRAFIAIAISSILELLGVTIIVPFITAVMNPEALMKNKYIVLALNILHISVPTPSILLTILTRYFF